MATLDSILGSLTSGLHDQLVIQADVPQKGSIQVNEDFDAQLVVKNNARRGTFKDVRVHVFPSPFTRIHGGQREMVLDLGRVEPGQSVEKTVTMTVLDAIAGPEVLLRTRLEATLDIESLLTLQKFQEFRGDVDDETTLDPDARRFAQSMYERVLLSNFELRGWSFPLSHSLSESPHELPWLKDELEGALKTVAHQRGIEPERVELAIEQLRNGYIERYDDPSASSRAWALWFYGIDADNWFSFDEVQRVSAEYLSRSSRAGNPALILVKGFDNNGVLAQPVTTKDLPVVLNPAQRTLTLWSATLND